MERFQYWVSGLGANSAAWEIRGTVESDNIANVYNDVLLQMFETLTKGKAVYGRPGIGCDGPYKVMKFIIERVT